MTWVTYENRAIYIYLPPNATKIDLFEAYIAPKIEDKPISCSFSASRQALRPARWPLRCAERLARDFRSSSCLTLHPTHLYIPL